MHSLFLDTASHRHVLALASESQTHVIKDLPAFGDTGMIPALEEALKEVKWKYADLTHIACVTGPGGFASIRTGITAANTLAYALKIPLAGVHVSDLWAARVSGCHAEHGRSMTWANVPPFDRAQGDTTPSFLWLHSTKKNLLFVRGFGTFKKQFPEPMLIALEDATNLQGKYVGELLEEHQKTLTGCTVVAKENIAPLGEALPALLKNFSYTQKSIAPWYGREP